MKLPAHVLFRKDLSLILWKPRGILDESMVNEIVAFIEAVEKRNREPLNRFSDLSALDAVDLNFDFVFHVALDRRLSAAPRPAVKSAFYVTSPNSTHYAKLHAILTDYSPLHVALFTDRAAAARWLVVGIRTGEDSASKLDPEIALKSYRNYVWSREVSPARRHDIDIDSEISQLRTF